MQFAIFQNVIANPLAFVNSNQSIQFCLRWYSTPASTTVTFKNINLLEDPSKEVIQALNLVGINRKQFFNQEDIRAIPNIDIADMSLVIGIAEPSSKEESSRINEAGIIFDPEQKGTVFKNVAGTINHNISNKLFRDLLRYRKSGETLMFASENRDIGGDLIKKLKEKGIDSKKSDRDPYYIIEDNVFINEFANAVGLETNLSKEAIEYVRLLLQEMVKSGRAVLGDLNSVGIPIRITGFRMRWKEGGKGADFDTIHTDGPFATMATSLALKGGGTEVFYLTPKELEIRTVPTNTIAHLLGETSGSAVRHSASTQQGPRLVFLVFWN